MEAGYMEKVDELCERYSLEGYVKSLGKHTYDVIDPTLRYRAIFLVVTSIEL